MERAEDGRYRPSIDMTDVSVPVEDFPCHRCGDALVLSVEIPHSFLRADGFQVHGTRNIGLCANCDRERPTARAVIDHFSESDDIAAGDMPTVAASLHEWLSEMLPARVDDTQAAQLLCRRPDQGRGGVEMRDETAC